MTYKVNPILLFSVILVLLSLLIFTTSSSTSANTTSPTTRTIPASHLAPCQMKPARTPNPNPVAVRKVDLVVVNRLGVEVEVRMAQADGSESVAGPVPHDQRYVLGSYSGRVWRFYASPAEVDSKGKPKKGKFRATKVLVHEVELSDAGVSERVVLIPCQELNLPLVKDAIPETWEVPPPEDGAHPHFIDMGAAMQRCKPEQWLSEVESPGFHIMCTAPSLERGTGSEGSTTAPAIRTNLIIYKDGKETGTPIILPVPTGVASLKDLIRFIRVKMDIYLPKVRQTPAIFTPTGRRFAPSDGIQAVLGQDTLFFFEGGQWIWPAVRVGHSVAVGSLLRPNETTVITTMSLKPRVFEVENFLSAEECEDIIKRAKPHLQPASTVMKDAHKGKNMDQGRISEYHFLTSVGNKGLQTVERRVQELTRVPNVNSEDTQVLRYEKGGFYSAHYDYFSPAEYANNKEMMEFIGYGARNRMATVFFYLNDVKKGGETGFPRGDGLPQMDNIKDCEEGIKVKAKKGKVIIFYSMLPNGDLDEYSIHGGCPVKQGVKWSANFWIWNDVNHDRVSSRTDGVPQKISALIGQPIFRESSSSSSGKTKDEL